MTEKEAVYYELLVLRCRRREEGALEELVRHWEKRLFYYIRRLVDNEHDAWDILQQTWIKVLRGMKTLQEPRSLPAWLYQVARNTVRSHWRRRLPEKGFESSDRDCPVLDSEPEQFRFVDAERVHYGLSRLSLSHREILTLHFLEDFSVEQIARILEIPTGTVKSRLYYAKCALKDVLQKEGEKP